ncbi:MAG: helix-turn-helix transcriptional regulator [Bacilli bacterium]|nr:helix-turn-helix transcriptional regulator [Bacilli bacterium]
MSHNYRVEPLRYYLIKLRELRHLTQKKVAVHLEMETHNYSAIENGYRGKGKFMNAERLVKLAEVFDISLEDICAFEIRYQSVIKEALLFERNSPEQNAIIRRYINECNSESFIQQFFHQEELI